MESVFSDFIVEALARNMHLRRAVESFKAHIASTFTRILFHLHVREVLIVDSTCVSMTREKAKTSMNICSFILNLNTLIGNIKTIKNQSL